MACVLIKAVKTTTAGGFPATVTGIDPASSDCLHGEVVAGEKTWDVRWNLGGICRDNPEDFNLDMRNDEAHDLRETAQHLGATW